jgi:hypothetical protein
MPGRSGNPGGRPESLAKATRELVGEDGMKLAEFWLSIMNDPMRRDSDRLPPSSGQRLGQTGQLRAAAGRPARLADVEAAAEAFRAKIMGLAGGPESDRA